MPTSKNINELIINKVENQDVYDYMQANGLVNDDELYLVEGENTSVLFVEQVLSDSQKAQARENIGALSILDELITVEDIDTICGATIQSASEVMF